MPRVLLLTYDAETQPARSRSFQDAGFTVEAGEPKWPAALDKAKKFSPDVIAVDCHSLPSHARETAEALRKAAETRDIPVVLFRVAEHDVERTRLQVPSGVVAYEYEVIDRLRSAAVTRIANMARAESEAARAYAAAHPPPPPKPAKVKAEAKTPAKAAKAAKVAKTPAKKAPPAAKKKAPERKPALKKPKAATRSAPPRAAAKRTKSAPAPAKKRK